MTLPQFGELFESSTGALWCIAAGVLNDRSRAQDVVQEAALIAMSKLHEFDPATSFVAWMGQIVRFVALNDGRKRQRERDVRQRLAAEEGERTVETAIAEADVFDRNVRTALESLDETPRMCLLLRTVMDMSYRQIAVTLGIPEGTAMSHVCRARRLMRDRLEEDDRPGRHGGSNGNADERNHDLGEDGE